MLLKTFELPGGRYDTRVQGQILISEVTGPWSVEQMDRWVDHTSIDNANLGERLPFANLIVMLESAMCPAAAMKVLRTHVDYLSKNTRLAAFALVNAAGVQGRGFVDSAYKEAFAGLCPFAIFSRQEEAIDWLNGLLAKKGVVPAAKQEAVVGELDRDAIRWHTEAAQEHEAAAKLHLLAVERLIALDPQAASSAGTRAMQKSEGARNLSLKAYRYTKQD